MTSNAEREAEWRAEFEKDGERFVYDIFNGRTLGCYPEDKRQYAVRWLRDREHERKVREHQIYWYARWTFWAAVAAVVVGVIGVLVTLARG
jgi:hypothetical protein